MIIPKKLFVSVFVMVVGLIINAFASSIAPLKSVPGVGNVIALTFDDGVRPEIHERMLDILETEKVPATFFLIGSQTAYPELIGRTIAQGHEIGNHSMTHPKLPELSDEQVDWEIRKFQDILNTQFGYQPNVFRAPMLQYDDRVMALLSELSLLPINANVGTKDWSDEVTGEDVYAIATANPTPGSIILMHEVDKTAKILPELIQFYKREGYEFATVTQLIELGTK